MNRFFCALMLLAGILSFSSCEDSETYAEMKEDEANAIKRFISSDGITVVSQSVFAERFEALNNGQDVILTDTSKNEYVLFSNSGVYMQIVDQGCGEYLNSGESASLSCRFSEWNLSEFFPNEYPDSMSMSNMFVGYISQPEVMRVTNTTGTFSGSFESDGYFSSTVGSSAVPAGWLIPMTYIKLGRPSNDVEKVAHVHLIVPSGQGHLYASQYVYPCFYDLYYTKNK